MRWLGLGVWATMAVAILALSGFACSGGGDDDSNDPSATTPASATNSAPSGSATARASVTSPGFGSPAGSVTTTPGGSVTPSPSGTGTANPAGTTPAAAGTPSPGGTATPPPSPGETPGPDGLSVRNHSFFIDSDGDIQLVGEVLNNTGQPVTFVDLTARFYGSSGQLLAQEAGYALVAVMPDGSDSPFEVIVIAPPAGITRYEVEVTGYQDVSPDSDAPAGLVTAETGRSLDADGFLTIDGTVTNTSGDPYEFVEIVGALYGPDGTVLRTGVGYIEAEVLDAGASQPFEMFAWDGEPVRGAPLRTWVNGYSRPEP